MPDIILCGIFTFMSFRERKLGDFLDARTAATDVLQDAGVLTGRSLFIPEAIVMQATAHLLEQEKDVYGIKLVNITGMTHPGMYPILKRFENDYTILASLKEENPPGRVPRRLYLPTLLGNKVFKLFFDSE